MLSQSYQTRDLLFIVITYLCIFVLPGFIPHIFRQLLKLITYFFCGFS